MTYLIISINIIMFIVESASGGSQNPEVAYRYGAMVVGAVEQGDIWRMVTCMFLHYGVVHLLGNMCSLFYIGPYVEMVFGKVKYLLIYLFGGTIGSIVAFCVDNYNHQNNLNVGASGAIFALLGAILIIAISKRFTNRPNVIAVIITIVVAIVPSIFLPNISFSAHIGGLIGGFVVSLIASRKLGTKKYGDEEVEQHEHGQVIYYGTKPKNR